MDKTLPVQKFEHNFFERTYPSIVRDISIAFSELIANAWDAGATRVDITIPSKLGEDIIIEDNGSGMTDEEFNKRWMVISYNRVEHQGKYIERFESNKKIKKLAYGQNGVGRHALICFNDYYTVETSKNGIRNAYDISTISTANEVLSVVEHKESKSSKSGTRLIVKAVKKLPNALELKEMLSYRFLFDPEFQVYINNVRVDSTQLKPVKSDELTIKEDKAKITIYEVPDGEKTTAATGIAFWVGNRLVGNPSWHMGGRMISDARKKFARRHIIVVNVDFLYSSLQYDWSDFHKDNKVLEVYQAVANYISKFRAEYYSDKIDEVKNDIIKQNIADIENLSIPSRHELKEFFDVYLTERPEVDIEEFNEIIKALIRILSSRNGMSLLNKISTLEDDEMSVLDSILSEWSIFDIKTVLDEIDTRLKIINAIEQLCSDKTIDELRILHPLVTQAKWLFGIEYDTINYLSNRAISSTMKKFFDGKKKNTQEINWSKRPDLVVTADFSIGISADENEISIIDKILIIELKRGGFQIGREEMNQAEEYVDFIYNGNALNSKPIIKAFVVGDTIRSIMANSKTIKDANDREYGEVRAYTYMQLVKTAEKRMFRLKEELIHRYNEMNVNDYLEKILKEPRQMQLEV